MIVANYSGETLSRANVKRLTKMVQESLDKGVGVQSRSGASAALAVNYCEKQGWPYILSAVPGAGYYVSREEIK